MRTITKAEKHQQELMISDFVKSITPRGRFDEDVSRKLKLYIKEHDIRPIKYLGHGFNGKVYYVRYNEGWACLKFTLSPDELFNALIIKDLQESLEYMRTFTLVYDVSKIEDYDITLILSEKVRPLKENPNLYYFWENYIYPHFASRRITREMYTKAVYQLADQAYRDDNLNIDDRDIGMIERFFKKIELIDYKIGIVEDLIEDNIGLRRDKLVILDFGSLTLNQEFLDRSLNLPLVKYNRRKR